MQRQRKRTMVVQRVKISSMSLYTTDPPGRKKSGAVHCRDSKTHEDGRGSLGTECKTLLNETCLLLQERLLGDQKSCR